MTSFFASCSLVFQTILHLLTGGKLFEVLCFKYVDKGDGTGIPVFDAEGFADPDRDDRKFYSLRSAKLWADSVAGHCDEDGVSGRVAFICEFNGFGPNKTTIWSPVEFCSFDGTSVEWEETDDAPFTVLLHKEIYPGLRTVC